MAKVDYAKVGRALLHPTQRKVLERMAKLEGKSISPNELSREMGEELGNVSYHVGVLAGRTGKLTKEPLIECVRTAPRRGALEHFYALIA